MITNKRQPRQVPGVEGLVDDEPEDECMEVRVVWGGTIEHPVPIIPPSYAKEAKQVAHSQKGVGWQSQ